MMATVPLVPTTAIPGTRAVPSALDRLAPARRRGRRGPVPGLSFALLLNAPALLAIVLLVGYPIAYSAWLSLHRYNLKRPQLFRFVGLENYGSLLMAPEFWAALQVTLLFTGLAVAAVVVLVLQTMLAIRVFDVIYVLTAGGPGTSTTTLVWQTYLTTFDSLDFGLGNAYAWTVSLITLLLALVYFQVLFRRGEFEA